MKLSQRDTPSANKRLITLQPIIRRRTWKWKMPAYLCSKSWSCGTTRAMASFLRVKDAMAARSQQSPVVTNRCIMGKWVKYVHTEDTKSLMQVTGAPTELSLANVRPVCTADDELGAGAELLWKAGNKQVGLFKKNNKNDSWKVTRVPLIGVFTFLAY